ncbi:MAG TPA: cyclopropane-fatty-acyl-phospholipid synthase family protein [bacterium]|nr:cyclopropane-fatty-acyl-phospholipid synthase family protein [bacterium]
MADMTYRTELPRIQPAADSAEKPVWLDGLARRIVLDRLRRIRWGHLEVEYADRKMVFGHDSPDFPVVATIRIHDNRFFSDILLGGGLGSAEAFMAGFWSTPNLTDVVRVMVRNMDVLENLRSGVPVLLEPLRRTAHWLNRNTRRGSRRNIVAHYDLGNDFFEVFLDPTMTYSAGIFETPDASLEQASRAKLDRLCRKLALTPGDHLLEIGTGWGSMAVHAAKNFGCRVTTTTISDEQYAWTEALVRKEGLSDRITLLKKDYRDLTGCYDKAVSIEMIEAVGDQFYNTYFNTISRLLKPDGMAAIQAIVISDQHYHRARKNIDFIKRFIFPGSCIPSINAIINSVTTATDMRLFHMEDITIHYARTLAMWREAFFRNIDTVRKMGFSDAFIRMWDFYLSYCEGGFLERHIGDVQFLFTKPLCRQPPILPPLVDPVPSRPVDGVPEDSGGSSS